MLRIGNFEEKIGVNKKLNASTNSSSQMTKSIAFNNCYILL